MKGIKVCGKEIEKVLKDLRSKNLINTKFKNIKEEDCLIIPLVDNLKGNYEHVERNFEPIKPKLNFREEVFKILNEEEKKLLKTAYDIVGTIAILEIDPPLHNKAKEIGNILLKCNPSIKTVVMKKGKHEGILRLQNYIVIAGDETLETIHKENKCSLKLNIAEVYYSARSSTERKRIFEKVKDGEKILVMFSGCGPFTCTIAKNTNASEVYGVELNEIGVKYAKINEKLNKLTNVKNIHGDVREISAEFLKKKQTFDRIIMPLPKTAEEFLPEAFSVSKEGTIIHLYDFKDEKEFPQSTISQINKYAKNAGIEYEILDTVKCGQFSPSIYRVCVDFKITKLISNNI